MLTIRLNRVGKKNKPYFRIVLQEHTIAPGGRHVEVLGSYDPHTKKAVLKTEKIKDWISKGAQASDTAYNLFVKNGIISGEKRKVKLPAKKEEVKKEEAPVETKEVKEEAPAEVKEPAHNASQGEAGGEKSAEVPAEEKVEEKKEETPKAE